MMDAGSSSKTFLGVRFFLFGFDPVSERQVRSKLIDGGGVGVGQYNQSCTHVIVDKIVYDDPICVAARNDGKTLVTGLWVDHSYDLGLQVDAASMMYRPLRDLNGIPGAKSLVVCLTNYLRQDREDIMTMVGLMGATFSKPLVANKVTHLICYKFEGEKYELAKKMKKIKLVNHQWLEDCLRDWQLLPEDDYDKSGFELDMMVAEAKDSDEEAEEPAVKQSSIRNNSRSPHDSKVRMLSATELSKVAMEVPNPTFSEDPVGATAKEVFLTPGKANRSSPSSNNPRTPGSRGFQEPGASVEVPSKQKECQSSTKYSPDAKFTAIFSKKSPKTPTLPGYSGEASGNASGSPKSIRPDDSSDFSPKMFKENSKYGAGSFGSPLKGSSPHHGEDSARILPQKRAIDVEASAMSSKSPKTSYNAAPSMGSPDLNVVTKSSASDAQKLRSAEKNDSTCLADVFGNEQNGNAEKSPMSDVKLTKSPESKSTAGKLSMRRLSHSAGQPTVQENMELDGKVASPTGGKQETMEFPSPVKMDLVEGATSKSNAKAAKKKTLAKKTLGSRPKLNDISSRKGSIYTNKIAPEDDPALGLIGVEERAATTSGNIEEASPLMVSNVAVNDVVAKAVVDADDETQTPYESSIPDLDKTLNEEKSDFVESAPEADRLMETESLIDNSGPAMHVDAVTSIDIENRVSPDRTKFAESNSEFASKGKTKLVRKRLSGYGKNKTAPAEPENNTAVEETRNEMNFKENGINLETAVSNDRTELGGSTTESAPKGKTKQVKKKPAGKAKNKTVPAEPENILAAEESRDEMNRKENGINLESAVSNDRTKLGGSTSESELKGKTKPIKKKPAGKAKNKTAPAEPENNLAAEESGDEMNRKENGINLETAVSNDRTKLGGSTSKSEPKGKTKQVKKKPSGKAKTKTAPAEPENSLAAEESRDEMNHEENGINLESAVSRDKTKLGGSTSESEPKGKTKQVKKKPSGKAKNKTVPSEPENKLAAEESPDEMNHKEDDKENFLPQSKAINNSRNGCAKSVQAMEEECNPVEADQKQKQGKKTAGKSVTTLNKKTVEINAKTQPGQWVVNLVKKEPMAFIFCGHRYQRKEFRDVVKKLKGRSCKDSHLWSYQATHFVAPEPLRRTEKFFAAAASGRWILKTDYLTACVQAGKFLPEEPYEWHSDSLTDNGLISLEAPRKWRLLRQKTGHGAFYGMKVVIYGVCIAPSLDTLKRVIKAGDGMILATSAPYTRFLNSGIDFAIVSPGTSSEDIWIKEFIKHKIPCIAVDYLVEYICKPGHPLNKHILFNTHELAEKSLANIEKKANEITEGGNALSDDSESDLACRVCGHSDREEVMIICGDESGSVGCGVGAHIDCCDPPLEAVPEGDWFCPECSSKSKKNAKSSKKKRKV